MTDVEDRLDIGDVLVRYATGIDRRDWPLFRTVFAPDCVLDYGQIGQWTGVDAVTDAMEAMHAQAGHTMHRMTNHAVTLAADRASARTYVDAYVMSADNAAGVNAVGIYDDELVRTAEGWRIQRRRFTPVRIAAVQNS